MKQIGLKLSVAIAAFVIGIAGISFWLSIPVPSNNSENPVGAGGGTAVPGETESNNNPRIKIIVTGRVIDNAGRPMRGARVQASLGLDLDGAPVETDADGRFRAEAASPYWGKGVPNFSA